MTEEKKPEVYVIPEVIDGIPTGRKIVHERGSLSERWNLIKRTADTPDEKREILDIEFRNLKKKMVKYNKDKSVFTDGYGEVFSGPLINKKNNYVKAAAHLLTDDVKLINKLINTPGWEWKSKLDEQIEKDDASSPTYWSEDLVDKTQELKKEKAKKLLLETTKKTETQKQPIKSDSEIVPLTREQEIDLYVKSLPQPPVEQIIKNRIKLKDHYSGIGSLNLNKPKTSTGLNYLCGLDDDEAEQSERRKRRPTKGEYDR